MRTNTEKSRENLMRAKGMLSFAIWFGKLDLRDAEIKLVFRNCLINYTYTIPNNKVEIKLRRFDYIACISFTSDY